MPSFYIIAGPNGAGKTTFIKRFAPRELALLDFTAHRLMTNSGDDAMLRNPVNANGVPSLSPGLPSPRGYPGMPSKEGDNPERVASKPEGRSHDRRRSNLFRVDASRDMKPRVGAPASRQPWAEIGNAVGVQASSSLLTRKSVLHDTQNPRRPLTSAVLRKANGVLERCHPQVSLRTLDAIHTAACDLSQDFPLCTTDKRMRDAANVLGIPIFPADEPPNP